MMSKQVKGFLAALLLAAAPASMAASVVNLGTINIDGQKSFSGDITDGNELDLSFDFTGAPSGKAKISTTIYSIHGDKVELWDTGGLVAAATYLGHTAEDPIGYNWHLKAVVQSGEDYLLKVFADNGNSVSGYIKVSTVPLPGAALLFGTALVGAGLFKRRRMGGRNAEMFAA